MQNDCSTGSGDFLHLGCLDHQGSNNSHLRISNLPTEDSEHMKVHIDIYIYICNIRQRVLATRGRDCHDLVTTDYLHLGLSSAEAIEN